MAKKAIRYLVLKSCRKGDKKPYKPGEIIDGKEFPAAVIRNWLEIGILEEVIQSGSNA